MKKHDQKNFRTASGLLAAFILWTVAVRRIDVRSIGPQGSRVGFATLNRLVHDFTGVHLQLYTLTDWLGLVPILIALGFALLGLAQWIHRKSIRQVDRSILVLGGFYAAVAAVFGFFETFVVNYRPVLIEGILEASYPSSTTLLVLCVMPTAILQLHGRIKIPTLRRCITGAMAIFTASMVIGRLICGVHWLTDIIGGILLSAGLVMMYCSVCDR